MRRDDALIPWSHEHQHGLAQALRLRRAAERGDEDELAAATADVLEFARVELAEHLASEEQVLTPGMLELGAVEPAELHRMAEEHARLRMLVRRVETDTGSRREDAGELARLLHDHIRWEERELFAAWQSRLAGVDPQVVARALDQHG